MRIGSALAASCAALIATAAADDAAESEVLESQPSEEVVEQSSAAVDDAPAEESADIAVSEDAPDKVAEEKTRRIEKRKQERDEVRTRLEDFGAERSKWRIGSTVAFANAEIKVIDADLRIPEDFVIEDLDLDIPEVTDLSSKLFIASGGYRVLPFLELTGQIGYLNSETATPFELTATIPEPDIDLDLGLIDFDEPITVSLDRNEDISGYTYGLGANAIAPVGIVAGHPLLATVNVLYIWNRLDGGNITSETFSTSGGLTYGVLTEKALYTFTAAAGYTRLNREAVRDLELAGETFRLFTEQELESPWSINLGVSRSLNDRWTVGYGLAANTAGPISHGVSLNYTPAKRK